MFNDILGNEPEKIEEDKDSIIEALKYNLKKKEKLIEDLVKQVTQLERILEDQQTDTHVVI
jgi:hypothetical protein